MPVGSDPAWRWGRAFSPQELARRLQSLDAMQSSVERAGASDAALEHYFSQAIIARDTPGTPRPGGAFERACELSARYEFSDPRIVIGHFDPKRPLLGRPLLLELRALGLHILAGVRINEVHTRSDGDGVSVFAWRYDTLPGHIEFGSEWFRVLQRHSSGEYARLRDLLGSGPLPPLPSRRSILHSGMPADVGRVSSASAQAPAELSEHSVPPTREVS